MRGTSRTDDDEVLMSADPATGDQLGEERLSRPRVAFMSISSTPAKLGKAGQAAENGARAGGRC